MSNQQNESDLDGALIIERAHKALANGLEVVSLELADKVVMLAPFEGPLGFLQSRVIQKLTSRRAEMDALEYELWSHWVKNPHKPIPETQDDEMARLVGVCRYIFSEHEPFDDAAKAKSEGNDFVTLLQCSAIIQRSKKTLERRKKDDPAFPMPDTIGGEGQPDEWRWSTIRPYLESLSGRSLPEIFPGHITG